jgi:hypothetical protein
MLQLPAHSTRCRLCRSLSGRNRSWSRWRRAAAGVTALVGAGKTAIAARFRNSLCRADEPSRPACPFVLSFHPECDPGYEQNVVSTQRKVRIGAKRSQSSSKPMACTLIWAIRVPSTPPCS